MGKVIDFIDRNLPVIVVSSALLIFSSPYLGSLCTKSGREFNRQYWQNVKMVGEREDVLRGLTNKLDQALPQLDGEPGISSKDRSLMTSELVGDNSFGFVKEGLRFGIQPGRVSLEDDSFTSTSPEVILEVYSPGEFHRDELLGIFDTVGPEKIHQTYTLSEESVRGFISKHGSSKR